MKNYNKATRKRRVRTYRSAIDIEVTLWGDLGSKSRWGGESPPYRPPPEMNGAGLPFIYRHHIPCGTKKNRERGPCVRCGGSLRRLWPPGGGGGWEPHTQLMRGKKIQKRRRSGRVPHANNPKM